MSIFVQSCTETEGIDVNAEDFIPQPRTIQSSNGSFEMTAATPINILGDEKKIQPLVDYFNKSISQATGFQLNSRTKGGASSGINLYLIDEGEEFNEGYRIEVVKSNLVISSKHEAGLFYGIQSLLQMFPPQIHSTSVQDVKWKIGTGNVRDNPAYAYRGAMLDVARHFFSVEDVKKVVDYLAAYKMNTLHLHLTDDQGWRIEIKSWPKLTKIGGSTEVGGGKGGFYTQEQYKEIVDYAAKHFVTIIPEIDMPGHTNAALASYPELNCNNKSPELYTGIEVGFSTLCTDKAEVAKFVDDVIRELAELTPGDYIHIGGDETHATSEEDYIPFITMVQEVVKKHNKKAVGWDEIALGKLQENTIVQFWDDAENAKKGVLQEAKVIMSPAKKAYMDMQYDSTSRLGLHWAAYIEADDAYNWHPEDYVAGIKKENIMGVEAPLWSETIESIDDIEYMLFPRLTAIAEIGWVPKDRRSWESYSQRLAKHSEVWDIKDINYYRSPMVDWELTEVESSKAK